MGVYVVQTMMLLDPDKGALDVDIQNMFNSLCRIAMLEDVVDSEELVGVDFTHMLPYLDMAYGEESGLWFKLDASSNGMGDGDEDMSEEQRTGWRRLRSRAGVHQGRPLSCFLAALGLVKCLLAAQRAMDEFHAMERYPEGVSDADKAKARELARAWCVCVAA